MTELYNQIKQDIRTATLSKDTVRKNTLQMLLADIDNQNIIHKKEITDDVILSVISKAVKNREASIAQFEQANRHDLAEKEKIEHSLLKKYLPTELTEDETRAIIDSIITENQIDMSDRSAIGKIMKQLGTVSGVNKGLASKIIQQKIGK